MLKKITKTTKKVEKKVTPKIGVADESIVPTSVIEPIEPTLTAIDGVQIIEVIEENDRETHYRLANGTTTCVPKNKI